MSQPKTPTELANDLSREFHELFRDAAKPVRYGWKRSKLDEQQREYIIQREAALSAAKALIQVDWQSIDARNKEFALKVRENALHSVATLIRAMTANEDKIL